METKIMKVCSKCVLPETYPGIQFDDNGVCSICNQGETIELPGLVRDFRNEQELVECIEKRRNVDSKYDVLVPLSGGVDSCYTLITIVEKYKLRVLGFHNDHGYEDETATENVRKLCGKLKVDLVLLQQDYEFMRKLWKYFNEADVQGINTCYVCGNILFLNSLEVAHRFDIPMVINGYSKGQAAMVYDKSMGSDVLEQLIEIIEKTGDKEFFDQFMDKYKILEKKINYQNRRDLETIQPGKILFVPFYVFDFYKTDKVALKAEIKKRFDWHPMKTSYPSRTTNCEMVWLNSYMDREKMAYSLYEVEYAEMVRKGDFTREQALEDLEFNPPQGLIERLAREVDVNIDIFKVQIQNIQSKEENGKKEVAVEFDF